MRRFTASFIVVIFLFFIFFIPRIGWASSIFTSPSAGTYSVGSTFDVSVLLDTKGQSINAMQVYLVFPPDLLQVVSPSTGSSLVSVWTVPPKFDNTNGTVQFEGGIPGGVITDKGILTTITFRVKSVGEAVIKFLDKSRVLLNNGLATDSLSQTENGFYELKLPPPAGPLVSSRTHPDQSTWYKNNNVVLSFVNSFPVEGYSYDLSNDPDTIPDNISEGTRTSIIYNNVSDGIHYFHIRALRDGVWGGITHFAIHVDTTPPSIFPVEILPGSRTSSTKPVVQFGTTDTGSGVDHYEIKIEPLSDISSHTTDSFFIETESPYVSPELQNGSYEVFVRAYDRANNYQEITKHLVITSPVFRVISDRGIYIADLFVVPWLLAWFFGLVIFLLLVYAASRVINWHNLIHMLHKEKKLPKDVQEKLEELQQYQKKYGIKTLVAIMAIFSLLLAFHSVRAQVPDTSELAPPLISSFSKDLSDKEIFYVGGKTDSREEVVILHLQNLTTGETLSETAASDKNGDWFYRHDTFLSPGSYILWAQTKEGDSFSPPSPQEKMTVKETALTFGANRLSYEAIYLFFIILLLLGILILVILIGFHSYHGRKKNKELQKLVANAEDSIRRGFAVVKRDIDSELSVIHQAQLSKGLSNLEKQKEAELLADMESISKHLEKEIWEINGEAI